MAYAITPKTLATIDVLPIVSATDRQKSEGRKPVEPRVAATSTSTPENTICRNTVIANTHTAMTSPRTR